MRCIVCNGDDIEKKMVDEEIKFVGDIVLVTMELLVCNACGERYYDTISMKKIEGIRSGMNIDMLKNQTVIGKVYRACAA